MFPHVAFNDRGRPVRMCVRVYHQENIAAVVFIEINKGYTRVSLVCSVN